MVAEPMGKPVDEGNECRGLRQRRGAIADAELECSKARAWPQIPPQILEAADGLRLFQRIAQCGEFAPALHEIGKPRRRQRFIDGGPAGCESSVMALPERRARRERQEMWQQAHEEVVEADALVTARHADMDMEAVDFPQPGQPLIAIDQLV